MPESDRYHRNVPSVEMVLQDYLTDHGFKPGDRLPTEIALCGELGVSRTSVREAMHSLRAIGIIELRRGQGAFLGQRALPQLVDGITFWSRAADDKGRREILGQITLVRRALERSLLTEVYGKHTTQDFAELASCIDEMTAGSRQGKRAWDADRMFHEILYRPLGNWILTGLLRSMWQSTELIVGDSASPAEATPAAGHQAILEALKSGDRQAAIDAMERHFDESMTEAASPTI